MAHEARPETRDPDQFEFGRSRDGWQHEVASRTEEVFRDVLFTRMSPGAVAAMRSQGGSGACLALVLPNMQDHEVGGAGVSRHFVAASPPTPSLDCAYLPVWLPA